MIQIQEQTPEEKIAMYMKLTKKELVGMLIECNRLLDSQLKVICDEYKCIECDVCKCKPSHIVITSHGTFCTEHAKY